MQHVLLVVLTCNIVECRILNLNNWFQNIFRNSYENKAGPFKPDTMACHLKDNISESGTVLLWRQSQLLVIICSFTIYSLLILTAERGWNQRGENLSCCCWHCADLMIIQYHSDGAVLCLITHFPTHSLSSSRPEMADLLVVGLHLIISSAQSDLKFRFGTFQKGIGIIVKKYFLLKGHFFFSYFFLERFNQKAILLSIRIWSLTWTVRDLIAISHLQ